MERHNEYIIQFSITNFENNFYKRNPILGPIIIHSGTVKQTLQTQQQIARQAKNDDHVTVKDSPEQKFICDERGEKVSNC